MMMQKKEVDSELKLQVYNIQELQLNVHLEKEFVDRARSIEQGDTA
jgi:hypothetical protein